MPVLEGKFKNLAGRLADLSRAACRLLAQTEKHACDILDTAIVENQPSRIVLQKACLKSCPPWVFYEVVRKVLVELDLGLSDYTQNHFKTIAAMMDQKQAEFSMPGPIQVHTQKGLLGFYNEAKALCLPSEPVTLEVDRTVQFGPWQISCQLLKREDVDTKQFFKAKDAFVEWFDADRIQGPIHARLRQKGDKFWPIGAKGEKKVGRFLIDAQLDTETKRQTFIITGAEKILWAAPVRMSEWFKLSANTRDILEICLWEEKRPD
jgi:tRNA(Ile)-lysidine synthase